MADKTPTDLVVEAMAKAAAAHLGEEYDPELYFEGPCGPWLDPYRESARLELKEALRVFAEHGWKLVPREPTDEMRAPAVYKEPADLWRLMFDAAPKPPGLEEE